MAYLDHAATTPMLDEALEAYVATARDRRQRLVAARGRPACPPAGRGVPRAGGRRARRPPVRGRSSPAAAPRATTSPSRASSGPAAPPTRPGTGSSAAPSSTTPCWTRSSGWPGTRGPTVGWLPVDALGRVDVDRVARRARRARRPGGPAHRDVGQQRGRHRPAGRRAGRGRRPARRAVPHRRHPGRRPGAGRLRRQRRRRADRHRAQARRPDRRRRAAARPRRRGTPLLHGGGQERDVRSGTLDTAGIVAFAVAVESGGQGPAGVRRPRRRAARRRWCGGSGRRCPRWSTTATRSDRLPGNAHFSFPGCEGDALLLLLDAQGIACSTGSACSAGVAQPSHVLLAMGADDDRARSSLRFTLGHTSARRTWTRWSPPCPPPSSGPAGPERSAPEPDRGPPRGFGTRTPGGYPR